MTTGASAPLRPKAIKAELTPEQYIQLIFHRKWIVLITFVVVTVATVVIAARLPNIYTSETVILVDPQKVPETYVKATVTGDVRNRLGTLTQQILSSTRLQKIIESFNLYPKERKTMAREDVITRMRSDINISMVNGTGQQQTLESFRITYSGKDPRLVAQVTNQLAALFIDENLKAREQQAAGTTEFLQHQMDEARKTLEAQEARLRDFRMKHLGEMPEHQVANLTVLGQLQTSLQQVGEALSRAEQQRAYIQSLMAQSMPVVDVDGGDEVEVKAPPAPGSIPKPGARSAPAPVSSLRDDKARLEALLARYTDGHPEVRKLRAQIADKEAHEARTAPPPTSEPAPATPAAPAMAEAPAKRRLFIPPSSSNPVLISQLKTIEAEIAKQKEEQHRLNKLVAGYQAKLEAVPLREQQLGDLVRDYEINKAHYTQFLDKQLSAETSMQLEIRQKGEQFSILDPAQPAQRPSSPKRLLIDLAGSMGGLILGLLFAVGKEFFGTSILSADQIPLHNGNQVLEVIPVILTETARRRKRLQAILATTCVVVTTLAGGTFLLYQHYRP